MYTAEKNHGENRIIYYDLLRILSCFSVIMLHSASQHWYSLPVSDPSWIVANSYDAMSRFGVPVFTMISGALFLDPKRELSLKQLYVHNILRLAIVYLVWSTIYFCWNILQSPVQLNGMSVGMILYTIISGKYHLWYLRMLIGLYVLLPILRTWLHSAAERQVQYFLMLFFLLQIGKQTIVALDPPFLLEGFLNLVELDMVQSYLGYFVLGYYMAHIGVRKRMHKYIYLGGVFGLGGAVLCSSLLSVRKGSALPGVFDSFSLFTFLVSVALFLFGKEVLSRWSPGSVGVGIIKELSSCTLGIYLSHLLVMEMLIYYFGIDSMSVNNLAGIPLLSLVCFGICLILTFLLRRIPYIKRYVC